MALPTKEQKMARDKTTKVKDNVCKVCCVHLLRSVRRLLSIDIHNTSQHCFRSLLSYDVWGTVRRSDTTPRPATVHLGMGHVLRGLRDGSPFASQTPQSPSSSTYSKPTTLTLVDVLVVWCAHVCAVAGCGRMACHVQCIRHLRLCTRLLCKLSSSARRDISPLPLLLLRNVLHHPPLGFFYLHPVGHRNVSLLPHPSVLNHLPLTCLILLCCITFPCLLTCTPSVTGTDREESRRLC